MHALGSACRTVGLCRPGSHLRPGGSETGKEEVPEEKKGRERKGGKREGRV